MRTRIVFFIDAIVDATPMSTTFSQRALRFSSRSPKNKMHLAIELDANSFDRCDAERHRASVGTTNV
jgi:hypothetical protein